MGFSPTSKAGRARSLCPQDPGALQCGIGAALNKNSVGVVFVQQVGFEADLTKKDYDSEQ
jgi:hypothetical protein